MADKSPNEAERLARMIDGLEEYITTTPDEELLEAAHEEGRDVAETSHRVKGILKRALRSHQQVQLLAAREGYRRDTAAMAAAAFELPKTTEGRRKLFMAAVAQLPQLQPAFTLQNREFKDLSDEDIEAQLRKMALLDLLSNVKVPEGE
jgi:hypothetical protein